MKKVAYLVLIILITGVGQVFAQAPTAAPIKEEMKKLAHWAGRWKGEGSTRMGPGEPKKSAVEETIQFKLDDTVILIEGVGKARDSDGKETVVHNAMGILSYDITSREYKFKSYLANGRSTDAWFTITGDNQYQWGFDTPQGKIKYSIAIDPVKKSWTEIGEFSGDGSAWSKFFEMNLTRVE